jgi:hypothetical protein
VELRIGDRSVDLRWSTIVVAVAPGPTPASAAALLDRGADAVLITVDEAAGEPAWSAGDVPFCCAAHDVATARRAIALGASFVLVSDRVAARALADLPPSVVVVFDSEAAAPAAPGETAGVPRLRDLRHTGDGSNGSDGAELVDVAAATLLDADTSVRVVLVDDPRPARRCADLVETLRREQAGVPT